ncbi:MAG: hypothetical protein JRF36_00880 [Deltaproteobacteria bacterium]|jgi:hypothetical protein|nr:hypothetical protein [Deltaproteobacteria bacterium]MBW2486410.1 hypothetical protein [Deltaproteobacteria bacterium]
MNSVRFVFGAVIMVFIIIGCSGDYARIKTLPADESKVTQQQLFDNWSDYTIWLRSTAAIFDPKNDDRKIEVGSNWDTVNDQAAWEGIVKANTTAKGNITPVWANYAMTPVREIRSPDGAHLFGYIIHQQGDLVSARLVDQNTMKLFYNRASFGGP